MITGTEAEYRPEAESTKTQVFCKIKISSMEKLCVAGPCLLSAIPGLALRPADSKRLHSPRLVTIGLSVVYETWPPIGWHHAFLTVWFKYRLGC